MSSIFSELVADVVLERSAAASENGKYLIGSLLGVPAAELYVALIGRANSKRRITTGSGADDYWDMNIIELDNHVTVLPYLVFEGGGDGDPNCGNRGFNGKLRDWFDRDAAPGEIRVLVTFDEDPVETQKTAMDEGLQQTALNSVSLLEHLRGEIAATSAHSIRPLLDAVVDFVGSRRDLSAQEITRSIHVLRTLTTASSEAEVGDGLVELPWLVRDPAIEAGTAKARLARAENHRSRIDKWSMAPDSDFDEEVRGRYAPALSDRLIKSRRLGHVRWREFTLEELQNGLVTAPDKPEKNRLNPSSPASLESAAASTFRLTRDTPGPTYTLVALSREPSVTLNVHLLQPLREQETIHVLTYKESGDSYTATPPRKITREHSPATTTIAILLDAVPAATKWFFCEVVLTETATYRKRYLGKIDVGVLVDAAATALPYDNDCVIDASAQTFVAADEPSIMIVDETGETEPAEAETIIREGAEGSETENVTVVIGGASLAVPIRYELGDEEEPSEEIGEHSAEHAALRFSAREGMPLALDSVPPLLFAHNKATVAAGGREVPLTDLPALGRSRWRVEDEILRQPEITNYSLTADGSVAGDDTLTQLKVGEELQPPFERFLEARTEFFEAVRERSRSSRYATVLAVPLNLMPQAAGYVDAYAALLDAVPEGLNWRPEYERLLLSDSVRLSGLADMYVAPTSPLAVALHMQFQLSLTAWAGEDVMNLFWRDPDIVSSRLAVPLARIGNDWYESRLAPYPWRIYTSRDDIDEAHSEPFLPNFIARRIEAFLTVHPVYRDQRRTLVLAFVNPGDGAQIKDGLLQLVKKAARGASPKLDLLPQFEIKLFAGDEDADAATVARLGADLDRFMTVTQESGTPDEHEQELMRRVIYTKARLDEYIADPSAFAHIAFVHNYFRPGTLQSYDLTGRGSTAYAGGIAVDLERASEIHPNDISFSSGVWLGAAPRVTALQRVIGRSAEIFASAAGHAVTANRGLGVLTSVSKHTIPALYDRAVWVVHLDRHIGLELFYPQSEGTDSSPYILDHTDQENLQESGFDAITATTMVKPYLALIESIFAQFVDGMDEARADRMLRWLNLLSGRWALQLLQETSNQIKERLAAVVAFRMLALRENIFSTENSLSLVITLDELLRVTGKEGLPLGEGWAAQFGHKGAASDDLLVLTVPLIDAARIPVYARIVEVKYSEGAAPTDKAWEQIRATQSLVQLVFGTRGPGIAFRGRVLAKLIRSYASRFASYGLLNPEIETDPRFVAAIDSIGAGAFDFITSFTRAGQAVIGDFISVEPNYDQPIYEPEPYSPTGQDGPWIGRVRIGADLIEALVANKEAEALAGTYEKPEYGDPAETSTAPGRPPADDAQPPASEEQVAAEPAPTPASGEPETTRDGVGQDTTPPAAEKAGTEGAEQAPTAPASDPSHLDAQPAAADGVTSALRQRFAVAEGEMIRLADKLDQVFARYGLPVQPFSASLADAGPNVIRFRTRMLEAGTIGSIEARARDIQRELAIDDPVYIGQEPPYVVVDVPRTERSVITLSDVLPVLNRAAYGEPGQLPVVMGVNAAGDVEVADLAQMPHLLVAGSTGSGKSVFLSTLGACVATLPTERVELVLIDIKGLDFAPFRQLPHTRGGSPIEDPDEAIATLESLMTDEVERRRRKFRTSGARQIIEHYRNAPEETETPQIVVMIDEYAQLASASGKSKASLEGLVQQYAQYARAFGIYLVLATQRPSVDVITGRIKANLPARCVFRLPSFSDSRTVIDTGGAEKLLGAGDMLFYRDGSIQRLQAVFTGPEDFAGLSTART